MAKTGAETSVKKAPVRSRGTGAASNAATSPAQSVPAEDVVQTTNQQPTQATEPPKPERTFSPNEYISVRNGFNGRLVYRSSATGERYVWERFGDEIDMELQDLKRARSASRVFFEKNWFMFDDPDVISYLGVDRYYDGSLSYEEFEGLFTMTPDEIEERLKVIPEGQYNTLARYAREQIEDGKIDSIRVVELLERKLGVKLTDR